MAARGYIYILLNPSMPGLLKIGKTRRTSDVRAEELSGETGVPSDFIVAYEVLVSDCAAAESEVHRELADFRFKENKEFFKTSLREAVRVVNEIAARFETATSYDGDRQEIKTPAVGDGLSPLHRACLSGDPERVWALLARGADPDSKTEDAVTPLMMAAGKGHSKIVDLLLGAGANADAVAADGSTAAGLARQRGHVFALNVLNHYRLGLGDEGPAGTTALMHACARKDPARVEALLRRGADPNTQNEAGDTALDIAARAGATKIAELLLRHSAWSPNAARIADENGHFVLASMLGQAKRGDAGACGDE